MSDTERVGWLQNLPPEDRNLFNEHFLSAIDLYRDMNLEGTVSQMESAFGDARDPLAALSSFRGFAASLRRQEERYAQMAEHIESIIAIMSARFDSP
jgi:hypothetical protein